MSTQIRDFPVAVLLGASVYLAPQIDRNVLIPNMNYFQFVDEGDLINARGSRFSPVDTRAMEEANARESKAGSSEKDAGGLGASESLAREPVPEWKPKTERGRKLLSLRQKYIRAGGELLDSEGIAEELRQRLGGLA